MQKLQAVVACMALFGIVVIAWLYVASPPPVVEQPSVIAPTVTPRLASFIPPITTTPFSDSARAACPVTKPNGSTPPGEQASPHHHGNDLLWTLLYDDSYLVVRRNGPDQPSPGWFATRWLWWRKLEGPLQVKAIRLDAPAAIGWVTNVSSLGDVGVAVMTVMLPSEGCWEVTATQGDASLKVIVAVIAARN